MSETISKGKSKRGERRSRTAVEFIVPLQLEQCLNHINHQPRGMPLRVTVTPAEDGTLHLTALLRHNGAVTVRCEGELRRWEGTSTQVAGQVYFFFDSSVECGMMVVVPVVWSFFGIASLALTGIIPNFSTNYLNIVFWGFLQLLFCFLVILPMKIRDRLNRRAMIIHLKRVLIGTEK